MLRKIGSVQKRTDRHVETVVCFKECGFQVGVDYLEAIKPLVKDLKSLNCIAAFSR